MNGPLTVPTIVGMACMNPGFRSDLFACSHEEQPKRRKNIVKLLSNYGLAADADAVDRLEQFVRPLNRETEQSLSDKIQKAKDKLVERGVAGKVHDNLKNKMKDGVGAADVAAAMVEGTLELGSPGSLKGACETWWDMDCPIWPCDPSD